MLCAPRADRIALRRFHLYDFGAHVAEKSRGERRRNVVAEFKHTIPGERAGLHVTRSVMDTSPHFAFAASQSPAKPIFAGVGFFKTLVEG